MRHLWIAALATFSALAPLASQASTNCGELMNQTGESVQAIEERYQAGEATRTDVLLVKLNAIEQLFDSGCTTKRHYCLFEQTIHKSLGETPEQMADLIAFCKTP